MHVNNLSVTDNNIIYDEEEVRCYINNIYIH